MCPDIWANPLKHKKIKILATNLNEVDERMENLNHDLAQDKKGNKC